LSLKRPEIVVDKNTNGATALEVTVKDVLFPLCCKFVISIVGVIKVT